MTDERLVCDRCCAFRRSDDPSAAAFLQEHDDCRPALRRLPADDPAIESYRENYEEA